MTIGNKISLSFAALVALTVATGAVSIYNLSHISGDVHSIVEGVLPGVYSLGQIQQVVEEQKLAMMEHIASETPEEMNRREFTIAELEGKFQAELKTYEKTIRNPKGRSLFEKVAPAQERFSRVWASIQPLSRALKTKEAMAMWKSEATPAGQERARVLNELSDYNQSVGDESGASALAAGASAVTWCIILLVFSLVSGAALAFFLVRGINKVLIQVVAELSDGAEQVSTASRQVSGSSQSLAQGASEQAASLEETSASSEEMASMTRKNAENSQQAAEFMNAVSQRVTEANRTLADMTTSMQEIGASSGKISKIIKVIDEIAFQTNILALNAAVEAARAGEVGMGFAVVADEVRNLAQRSAQAAKDTASLIEESILKSTEGSRKLGEVATSIHDITEGAGKVKTLVDEVEASSKEQAQGILQISKAVAQMDQVTQRTAANAEESASAGEELNAQSQALMTVVEHLKALVGAASGSPAAPRRPVAAKHTPVVTRPAYSPRTPVTTAVGTPKASAAFPLDDSDFREF